MAVAAACASIRACILRESSEKRCIDCILKHGKTHRKEMRNDDSKKRNETIIQNRKREKVVEQQEGKKSMIKRGGMRDDGKC